MACGVLFWSTFSIRTPDYGVLPPSAWPRFIIVVLTVLSAIFLIEAVKRGDSSAPPDLENRHPGLIGWIKYWRNPIICFALFFAYLVSLPILGSLIGGVAFVFVLMGVIGGWKPKNLVLHALLAVASVGGMWSIFTYVLGVILPSGEIFSPF